MKLLQIDAFTSEPFRGNPAAVCFLDRERNERWMQDAAAEMHLSATAYLVRAADGYSLRWFTPTIEVPLCGHGTLASAHALWEEGAIAPNESARFHTKSGLLTAERKGELIELDFPAVREERFDPPAGLLESLGVSDPIYVGRNKLDFLVEVSSEDTLRGLTPDHGQLRKVPVRGVIVTARASTPDLDFVSRFFAPGSGIDEDPVTGSAHCCLTPYWSARLGKMEMRAYQASRRGGTVHVRLDGDRVKLGGQAVTVLRGELQ
jgi:PhzF family phenazine biosynthesis protein